MKKEMMKVTCFGCGHDGFNLESPVDVLVEINDHADNWLNIKPKDCPYNTGGHGQRCKASHPEIDKDGDGFPCKFSFDFPMILDDPARKLPKELKERIDRFIRYI